VNEISLYAQNGSRQGGYVFDITIFIYIIQHRAHNRQLQRRVYKVFPLTN